MTAAMPLLSASESYKLHAALLEYSENVGPEWSMYTTATDELVSPRQGSERLAKATKDLMSLDQSSLRWNESADRAVLHDPVTLNSGSDASAPALTSPGDLTHEQLQTFQPNSLSFSGYALPPNAFSHVQLPQTQVQHHRPSLTVSPAHTFDLAAALSSGSSHSISSVSAETTPPPATPPGSSAVNAGGSSSLKRAHAHDASRSDRSDLGAFGAGPSTRHRPARPPSKKRRNSSAPHDDREASSTPVSASGSGGGCPKPPLLTPSQKKANHIQSEQKRRANIRRGYEALCDRVPALRAAIKAEEEAQAAAARAEVEANGGVVKKSRRRGRKVDESLDGRAGPRSENVILQKTIDYITDLLSERSALLDRLQRARSMLMPSHPQLAASLAAPTSPPLWERAWHGGTGEGVLDDNDNDADAANDSDDDYES